MDILILILICVCLIVHRNLSAYHEFGTLPHPGSFLFYTLIFNISIAVSLVWLFGIFPGVIVFGLTYFQITYSAFLWPFLLPDVIRRNRYAKSARNNPLSSSFFINDETKPNGFVEYSWSWLVIILLFLTVINFFIGEYSSVTHKIFELANMKTQNILFFAGIGIIGGNLLRIITMKLLFR